MLQYIELCDGLGVALDDRYYRYKAWSDAYINDNLADYMLCLERLIENVGDYDLFKYLLEFLTSDPVCPAKYAREFKLMLQHFQYVG